MALSAQEKQRVRHHMGYYGVNQAQAFVVGGIPAPLELNFMIEGAMNRVALEAEDYLRKLLDRMDRIEEQIIEDQPNLAGKVGNVIPNFDEFKMLLQQYSFWQGALSNLLAVPANPFDKRFANMGINVAVSG